MNGFSLSRWLGILIKEFIQLKRDRLTFGMIIGVPILQLLLFGFAINSDPKHLVLGIGRPVVPEKSWMDAGLNDSTGLVSDRP